MGNYLSSTTSPIKYAICKCGKGIATYRCNLRLPLDASEKDMLKIYFALKRYSVGNSDNRELFISCPLCISLEHKKYFVYHPEGWRETLIEEADFEDLRLE